MKKVIGKVRLCPNTVAWSNVENNIFLSKARRKEMDVHEGCDMDVIMAAVESGLIEFKEVKEPVKQVKTRKASDIAQEAKKKAAARAKKNEVKVDVNVESKEVKEDDNKDDVKPE